jgi:putative SOS response-associated peptidase YedK
MCGRYSLATVEPAALRARFGLASELELVRRYNVCPGDLMPAVTLDGKRRRRGELLRWGLVPSRATGHRATRGLINARCETAAVSPAFRAAMARLRCLVLADGFYEWERGPNGRRRAFWITRADGAPFAFAGLWSIWRPRGQADGPPLRTFAILTRAANAAVAPVHPRMPVILRPEHEAAWLDPETPAAQLATVLCGLSAQETALHPVGPAVNDPRCEGPECLEPPRAGDGGPDRLLTLF